VQTKTESSGLVATKPAPQLLPQATLGGRTRNPAAGDALRLATLVGDAALFLAVQLFAFWFRLRTGIVDQVSVESPFLEYSPAEAYRLYLSHFILGTLMFLIIGGSFRIYSRNAYLRPRFVLGDVLKTCVVWMLAYLLFSLFFKLEPSVSRVFVVMSACLGFAVLAAWRMLFNRWIRHRGLLFHVQDRLLVIGWSKDTDALWRRSNRGDFREITIAGVLPVTGASFALSPPSDLPMLGSVSDLETILAAGNHDAVLLADTSVPPDVMSRIVQACHREMVRFMAIPAFFEVLFSGLHLESIRGVPVLSLGQLPLDSLLNRMAKRATDIAGALFGLGISAPALVISALLVQRESPGPVFFSQERVGRNGKTFRILKLRTMHPDAAKSDHLNQSTQRHDPRVLRVGSVIRSWNIDETPQFWNVLKGDMSLVGPRPERTYHTSYLRDEIRHYNVRHTVKPGMTGWAAVNGWRGDTSLNERIRFDLDYIERWSLLFDCYIMLLTFSRNRNAY
jgi:exopolysaccharide biosynthesis polyprenyl glycosylphosphotransferase